MNYIIQAHTGLSLWIKLVELNYKNHKYTNHVYKDMN